MQTKESDNYLSKAWRKKRMLPREMQNMSSISYFYLVETNRNLNLLRNSKT
jgi:hypothetical protein